MFAGVVMNEQQKAYVKSIYYADRGEAAFGGIAKLYAKIKRDGRFNIKRKDLQQFLEGEELYTVHKSKHRPKDVPPVIVPGPGFQLSMDSGVMSGFVKNRERYFVLGASLHNMSFLYFVKKLFPSHH